MSNRQYGIPAANWQQAPPAPPHHSTESHQLHDYPPSGQPVTSRSPPRRPVAPYERKPVSSNAQSYTPYQGGSSTPPRYQQDSYTSQRDRYGTAAAGGGFAGAGGDIADSRDDNYYSRGMASQPESQSQYAAYAPTTSSRQARPTPQHSNSQNPANPFGSSAELSSQPPSPPRGSRGAVPAPAMAGYGYGYDQPMPRSAPYRGDGYEDFDPRDIADDGDEGWEAPSSQRRSRFTRGGAVGAGAGATAGAGAGVFGSRDPSGNYGPVPGGGNGGAEKSEWLEKQSGGGRRFKRIAFWILGIVVVLAVIGGVLGGLFASGTIGGGGGGSSNFTPASQGLYDIDSSQVQAVLNDDNLHRVFPGMDYTPLNAQYPACLSNPPDQNNVTLDVAVLSQLTPAIRLYGTDCKQTEMVLKGIDQLGMNDTMKVWLGVWLDKNTTTSTRQVKLMHDILDTYPAEHFAGIIIGNEVLYREDLTETQIANQLREVRQELASRNIDLPVATSDLGDDWTQGLADDSDIVMSNVHPFFAGVKPEEAPDWTWNFWQTHDVILKDVDSGTAYPNNIISETGWPSEGGNACGTGRKCPTKTAGAIAGIDEMNTFMNGWVCQSLAKGTSYFWFEAFDEPWKEQFNDPQLGDFWEPHWGLMDQNRKLKDGVKIPDCGGKSLSKPY